MLAGTKALLPCFAACVALVLIGALWKGSDSVDYGGGKRGARARAQRGPDPAEPASAVGESVLYFRGRLTDSETGEPVAAPVTVFGPGGTEHSAQAGADGVFQVGCSKPGRVTIAVPRTEGHFGLCTEAELKEHMALKGFGLQPRRDLPVLMRTPDGRPLSEAFPPPASWAGETWPSVLITPVPPAGRNAAVATDPFAAPRLGVFLSCVTGGEPRRAGAHESCAGYLRLCQAPPVQCSLVIGSRVLQTQTLDGREKLLSFLVDPADLGATRAEIELRVVDADTGLPTAPRRGLWLGRRGEPPTLLAGELDSDGRLALPDVPAGPLELHLRLSGYEQEVRRVELRAGERNDVGELRVSPGACLAGRVIGETGEPVAARVWSSTREGHDHPVGEPSETPEGADWFAICGLPRTKVLVGVEDPQWALNPIEVDLSNGSAQNQRIVAKRGTSLRLVGPFSAAGSARMRVLDQKRLCVWHGENLAEEVHELRLLPGRYTVEVRRASGATTRQEVDLEKTPDATILLR